ncbi:hypothetical protein [Propylenella binzhouense]|uniref:hypothetical protein n=1 Tax=Propylenella binzhouense TaxID=2555902 RepID=UPI00136CB10B|nr:hypothetical protein [Propylenella binzhouense]
MIVFDRIFALLGLAALCAFLGVLVWKVPLPALIAVCAIGVVLAAIDFARTLFMPEK